MATNLPKSLVVLEPNAQPTLEGILEKYINLPISPKIIDALWFEINTLFPDVKKCLIQDKESLKDLYVFSRSEVLNMFLSDPTYSRYKVLRMD